MKKIKNILFYFLRISITLFLLIFLFHKQGNRSEIIATVKEMDAFLLAITALFYIFIVFLAVLRWQMLLKTASIIVPLKRVIASYATGLFINLVVPVSTIGGDTARSVDIFEYAQDKSRIVASVILDRLSGFVSVALVSFIALLVGYRWVNNISILLIFASFFCLVLLILSICFSKRMFQIVLFLFSKFTPIRNKLIRLSEAMIFFRDKRVDLWKNLGMSLVLRFGVILIFYLTAIALHAKESVIYFFIFVPILEAMGAVPFTIGGIGIRENASKVLFTGVGFNESVAIGMALVNSALVLLIGLIGGIIYVFTLHTRRI